MASLKNKNNSKETSINDTKEANDDDVTLDAILIKIGQFGKYQMMVCLMISIPMMCNAIYSVTFVFTASTLVHRCNITDCDTPSSSFYEPWLNFSIPSKGGQLDQCHRYAVTTWHNNSQQQEVPNEDRCLATNFNRSKTEECAHNELIFLNEEKTISNEFGIVCGDEWKLSMVGTTANIGQFIGIPIGGFLSDKYGRHKSLAFGGVLASIFGLLRSFSPNYTTFLIFEFLDNMANSTLYATVFIVGIELVGPHLRVLACTIITVFYALGEMLLGLLASRFQNWRILLRIVYSGGLIHITYFWLLPESVRWLLSQRQEERAKSVLKRAAIINGREVPENLMDKLVLANRAKMEAAVEAKFPLRDAFSKLFGRILNCCFCWIVNVLIYYGLSLNSVLLDGDKYHNFMLVSMVEIPGFVLPFFVMNRLGRRHSLFVGMLISGFCCLSTVLVANEYKYLQLALFLTGKLTITASFQVLYFYTSEIFPTPLRNSLLSFCSSVGRIGSIVAPQTPLLAKYYKHAPALLFAVAAIFSSFLTLLFPETTNEVLPSTMQEATDIGAKSEKPRKSELTVESLELQGHI